MGSTVEMGRAGEDEEDNTLLMDRTGGQDDDDDGKILDRLLLEALKRLDRLLLLKQAYMMLKGVAGATPSAPGARKRGSFEHLSTPPSKAARK